MMNSFYNVEDAYLILKTKKKYKIAMILIGILTLGIIVLLTSLSLHTIIMIIDIVLSSFYLGFLYTYFFFIRKELNARYHFLACIDNYDHEILEGEIVFLDDEIITVSNIESYTIKIDNRTLFIENVFLNKNPEFSLNRKIKVEIVDKFIIGFEVDNHE